MRRWKAVDAPGPVPVVGVAMPDPPFALSAARTLDTPGPDLVELLGVSPTLSK